MRSLRDGHLIVVLLGSVVIAAPGTSRGESPAPTPLRATLRVDWSNPGNVNWDGLVRLSAGRIVSTRPLELRRGPCEMLPTVNEREVRFCSAGPVAWSGLELVVEAPARASVELAMGGHRLETPLEQILEGSAARMEWDGWARLRRDPADILRIHLNRPHLVFAPDEEVDVNCEIKLLTAEPQVVSARLRVELRPVRSATVLFPAHAPLRIATNSAEPIEQPLKIRVPAEEGAYDLVVRVEPAGLKPIERVVQLVVVNPNPLLAVHAAEPATQPIDVELVQPDSGGRWYSTRRLFKGTSRLGQLLWSSVRHPFSAAEPASESPASLWRLNVKHATRPHLLNIEYDDKGGVALAACLTEQDPAGRWIELPVTSGVKSIEASSNAAPQTHQFIFWPQTSSPHLWLTVEGPNGATAVKRVRAFELPQGLPRLDVREPDGMRRLLGLQLDEPAAWQGLGRSRAIDAASGLALDDWRTFLDSVSHLAEYASYSGYNCVAATVVAGGEAMYPSELVSSGFLLDTGALADAAPDPFRKDFVELLMRVCERNRLGVVPTIRFDGPVPSIDRKLAETDPVQSGLVLISREGKSWDAATGSRAEPARRYNPLHPEVQAAMLDIVREFVQRYAAHPGFDALTIDLAAHSHTVLAGPDWGYDDWTIAQFVRDSGLQPPAAEAQDERRFAQRHQWLTGPALPEWTTWRCRQLARFYERLLEELQRVKPEGRLVLSMSTLLGSGTDELREAIRQARTIEDLLRGKGIDLASWSVPREILLLRPYAATGSSPEALHVNASRELEELVARAPCRGTLCVHEPELLNFTVAPRDKNRSIEPHSESMSLPFVSSGRASLRRFAQSMAGADCQAVFDGGRAMPLGQERLQREFARVFRALPATDFHSVETLQPIVVRSHHGSGETTVYLVNEATYPVETNLSFSCPAQTVLTNRSTEEKLPVQTRAGGVSTKLTLEPFQTVSLRLSRPGVSIAECNVVVPSTAEKGLKARWERISQAMLVLNRDGSSTLDDLPPNGDFEQSGETDDSPARWSAEGATPHVALDRNTLHGGTSALQLNGTAGDGVASDPFSPPTGRALALNAWLRADRPGLRVRWFLVGNQAGEPIYGCYADVTLQATWEQKQFRANDLPEGPLTDVRIKFQLLDPGTVWIDEARVRALPISNEEQRAILKSVASIFRAWKERRLSDFERLADGYWATYLVESVEGSTGGEQKAERGSM